MRKYFNMLLLSLFLLSSCEKDDDFIDVDGLPPGLLTETEKIATEPGREFIIKAKITDNDGLRSVNLKNSDFHLNKTIDLTLDGIVHEYDLNYKFKVPADIKGDQFPLEITVTDLGGRTSTSTVIVSMDGDFDAPVFTVSPDQEITVLLKPSTRLNVKFNVEDNKALDVVKVSIPELNYEKEVRVEGKSLSFIEGINLPAAVAAYTLQLKATDKAGLSTEKQSIIRVSEMPDFPKMYLSDVDDAALLNSDVFGRPMLIERTAPFTYRARYYAEKAGVELRFLPQKTDFAPIAFGIDPENSKVLTDDPEISKPIVLGSKGYYEITFNVKSGEYHVGTYTPADKPLAIGTPMLLDPTRPGEGSIPLQIGLVGAGLPDAGNWNPAEPLILTQDSENKFLFTAEMNLTAGTVVEFIISAQHSWGWWPEPFWRWDRSNDPESNVSNGGENPGKWTIKTSGRYVFKFDTHLKRSQFFPKN
ncbi:hypothetical protein [Leadbetterella byssophila]|uniref:hypothetical protein n=1 Tax=Leadbetterella byssophila TaxID=316068 RepID=UPI00399F2C8D